MRHTAGLRQPLLHLVPSRSVSRRCAGGRPRHPRLCTAASAARHNLLFVAPVWPERSSSAAGVRTSDLIASYRSQWNVHFLSTSKPNQHSEALTAEGVQVHHCPANREQPFHRVLHDVRPQVCVFDRFYAEEAFSFHVHQQLPDTLRVLDMQDMHALRQGRMEVHQAGGSLQQVLDHRPAADQPMLQRELAAIHRCDLTLVCSPVELQLLRERYSVSPSKLALAPFFVPPPPTAEALPPFGTRRHFVSIGNFKHPPNLDSVKWLADELWDAVRQRLGDDMVELHLYGAYASHAVQQLHDPARNLFVKGHMPSLEALCRYRVALAPLRFGAGLKGKVTDSWTHGLPVVTTAIGSEGIHLSDYAAETQESYSAPANSQWGGFGDTCTSADFADQASLLYSDEGIWRNSQRTGIELLRLCFDRDQRLLAVQDAIAGRLQNLTAARQEDYVGQMLWQQGNRATEYFSRWIELKERAAGKS